MVNGKRARLKAYGLVFGVFLLGSVAGGATVHALSQRDVKALLGRDGFERRRLGALSRELSLTGEQETQLREIFKRRGEERRRLTTDIMDRCGDSLEEQRRQTDEEVKAVLNPEQRARFDQLMAERGPPFGRTRRKPRR